MSTTTTTTTTPQQRNTASLAREQQRAQRASADAERAEQQADATATGDHRTQEDEAVTLANAARELARGAGLKSAYSRGEARGVLDNITITNNRGTLTLKRDDVEFKVKTAALKAYLAGEGKDTDDVKAAAQAMKVLSHELPGTVYGRKLSCFILAAK